MSESREWMQEVEGGVQLLVRIVPNASRNEIIGLHDGRLKVRVMKPAVDGAANKALQQFFAKQFGVSKSSVQIVAGELIRKKSVVVLGVTREEVAVQLPFFDM